MRIECTADGVLKLVNVAANGAPDKSIHFQTWEEGTKMCMQGTLTVEARVDGRGYSVDAISPVEIINMEEAVHFMVDPKAMRDELNTASIQPHDMITLTLHPVEDEPGKCVLTLNDNEEGIEVDIASGDLRRKADFPYQCTEKGAEHLRVNGTNEVHITNPNGGDFQFVTAVYDIDGDECQLWEIEQILTTLTTGVDPDRTKKGLTYMRSQTAPVKKSKPAAAELPVTADQRPAQTRKRPGPKAPVPVDRAALEAPPAVIEITEVADNVQLSGSIPAPVLVQSGPVLPDTQEVPEVKVRRKRGEKQAQMIEAAVALLRDKGYTVVPPNTEEVLTVQSCMHTLQLIHEDAAKTMAILQTLQAEPTSIPEAVMQKIEAAMRDKIIEECVATVKAIR